MVSGQCVLNQGQTIVDISDPCRVYVLALWDNHKLPVISPNAILMTSLF